MGTRASFKTHVRSTGFSRKPDNFRLKAVLQTFKTGFEMPSNYLLAIRWFS